MRDHSDDELKVVLGNNRQNVEVDYALEVGQRKRRNEARKRGGWNECE